MKKSRPEKRILTIWLLVLFIIVFLATLAIYRYIWTQKTAQIAWQESELLTQSSTVFSREMGHIKRITLLLRNSVNAHIALQAKYAPYEEWQDSIADEFRLFAQTSDLISQVRWISSQGMELVRINSYGNTIIRVPSSQLQNKADRDYFQQAPKQSDLVYISPLDLNIDNDEVVWPYQPTVRGVVRISGPNSGLLVVNYNLASMFEKLRLLSNEQIHLEVLDQQGGWLLADEKSLEWSHVIRGQDPGAYMASQFPSVWEQIANQEASLMRVWEYGRLWSFIRFYLDEDESLQSRDVPFLYLVVHSEPSDFARWHIRLLLSLSVIALVVYGLFSWWGWRYIQMQSHARKLLRQVKKEKIAAEQLNQKLTNTNQKLVELQDELVETSKLSSLGVMVSGLAHEINTPLGGIKLSLSSAQQVLQQALTEQNHERLRASLTIAEKNLARAMEVISSFKRISSDRTGMEKQSFIFNDVLEDLLFSYQPVLKKRPKIIVISECDETISMFGYPGVFSQILQNLLDNAFEYAFPNDEEGQICIFAKPIGKELELTIEDDGYGIPPEIKDKVFDPFKTSGRQKHHTGLGLYLVHQWVCKLMHGHVKLTSELGVGTRFIIRVPLFIENNEDKASSG